MSEALDPSSRENCRDAIDRFLDRSWLLEKVPVETLSRHRLALNNLDFWLQRHRAISLSLASAKDVRELLNSDYWDAVSYGCESLVSLVASFFKSLQETRFRFDDPIVTLIDQEMAAAAKHSPSRPSRSPRRGARVDFSMSPVT